MIKLIENIQQGLGIDPKSGVLTRSGQSVLYHAENSSDAVIVRPLQRSDSTGEITFDQLDRRLYSIDFYKRAFSKYCLPTRLFTTTANVAFKSGIQLDGCPIMVKVSPWVNDVVPTSDLPAEQIFANNRLRYALLSIYSKSLYHLLRRGILPDLGWTDCVYNRGPLGLNIGSPNIFIGNKGDKQIVFLDNDLIQIVSEEKEYDPHLKREAIKHLLIKLISLSIPNIFIQKRRIHLQTNKI